jgi:hypothetical protein
METYQSPLQKSQASYPRNVDSTAKFCLGYTFRKVAHLSQPLGHELAYISSTIVLTLCARPHRVWPIGQVTTSTKQSAKSANGFESQQELITYDIAVQITTPSTMDISKSIICLYIHTALSRLNLHLFYPNYLCPLGIYSVYNPSSLAVLELVHQDDTRH